MIEVIVVIIVFVVIVVIVVIVVVVVIVLIASKQFLSLLLMKSASTPMTFGGSREGRGALFQLSPNCAVDQNQPYHDTGNAYRTNFAFDTIHIPPTADPQ